MTTRQNAPQEPDNQTVDDVAEEIRAYMEQNKMAVGSTHARSVLYTLYNLGYGIVVDERDSTK